MVPAGGSGLADTVVSDTCLAKLQFGFLWRKPALLCACSMLLDWVPEKNRVVLCNSFLLCVVACFACLRIHGCIEDVVVLLPGSLKFRVLLNICCQSQADDVLPKPNGCSLKFRVLPNGCCQSEHATHIVCCHRSYQILFVICN